jgi:hypothetical protein
MTAIASGDRMTCMTPEQLATLASVEIASPCPVQWKDLDGDERKRFCGQCKQHVFNLEELTIDEVMVMFREARRERVCMRFFRRADGTVITRDCDSAFQVAKRVVARRMGTPADSGPTRRQWQAIGVSVAVIVVTIGIWASEAYAKHVRRMEALGGSESVTTHVKRFSASAPPQEATRLVAPPPAVEVVKPPPPAPAPVEEPGSTTVRSRYVIFAANRGTLRRTTVKPVK